MNMLTTELNFSLFLFYDRHTERIKAIYFINAARWICELLEVLKHCVPATLSSRMHIFSSPNEKFRQEFHEHDLSIDYGGKASSLDELTGKS